MGAIGKEACAAIFQAMKELDGRGRGAAARALAGVVDPEPGWIGELAVACQKEEDPEARAVMIDTLSVWRFDADRFLEMLIPALGAENAALQSSVMNALILLDRPSETSVPALVRVLEGKDLPLARRAASTLGHLGSDARAAVQLAHLVRAAAILTVTETGSTSRAVSKCRPRCPILAMTSDESVVRRLCLNWGVTPLLVGADTPGGDEARIAFGLERAQALGRVRSGDRVVTTAGVVRTVGTTNSIRVVEVP